MRCMKSWPRADPCCQVLPQCRGMKPDADIRRITEPSNFHSRPIPLMHGIESQGHTEGVPRHLEGDAQFFHHLLQAGCRMRLRRRRPPCQRELFQCWPSFSTFRPPSRLMSTTVARLISAHPHDATFPASCPSAWICRCLCPPYPASPPASPAGCPGWPFRKGSPGPRRDLPAGT